MQGPADRLSRKLKFHRDSGGGYETLIAPRWLVGLPPEFYQKRLKQAFLLAAIDLKISDASHKAKGWDRKKLEALRQSLLRKRNSIREGIQVHLPAHFLQPWTQIQEEAAQRQPMVMQNTRWLSRSTRHFFTLQGAELTIFERQDTSPSSTVMDVSGAQLALETDPVPGIAASLAREAWNRQMDALEISRSEPRLPGTHRVVLSLPKTRIWLCAGSQALAKHWYRSIRLAQRIRDSKRGKLALEAPLETLSSCLRQCSRRRAWKMLVLYHQTWHQRQRDLCALAKLCEEKAVRRLWRRLWEVQKAVRSRKPPEEEFSDDEVEEMRHERHQQFLRDLRHQAVSWVQARARHLCGKGIQDLPGQRGPPNALRVLRARMPVGASYEAFFSAKGGLSRSSPNSLPPCEAFLWSDATHLHLCERLEHGPGFDLLTRLVPLEEISALVMHSDRVDQFNPHAGPWLTIHGPRLKLGQEPHPMTKLRSQDAVRITIAVRSGRVLKPKLGTCTRAYLSLLGRRISSSIQTGEEVDYTCALDRWIPLPLVDKEAFLTMLENAVCGLDIVQELHPDVHDPMQRVKPVVLCGNRLALWRLLTEATELPKEKGVSGATFSEHIEKAGQMSMSWRLPLLKYGSPEEKPLGSRPELYIDLEVKAEYISKAPPRPRLTAPEAEAYYLPLFEGHELLQLELTAVRSCDLPDGYLYHVELDLDGLLQASCPLHCGRRVATRRGAREVSLEGCRLRFPPLPAASTATVRVMRRPERVQDLDFHGLSRGSSSASLAAASCVYRAALPMPDVAAKLATSQWIDLQACVEDEFEASLLSPLSPFSGHAALQLTMSTMTQPAVQAANLGGLSVGDAAVLSVEEVLTYPSNESDFKDMMLPGRYDADLAGTLGVPLRLPRTMVELVQSGLPRPAKGGPSLVVNCLRVPPPPFELWPKLSPVPVKFVFHEDETESDLLRRQLPVSLRRAQEAADVGPEPRMPAGSRIVQSLTHARRQVSVKVISIKNDGLCDVELSWKFLRAWQARPTRRYCLPGHPSAFGEQGEVPRVLLKGVPAELLQVEQPSFHVFDAMLLQSEDAMMSKLSVAGPVPWDVLPEMGCHFEWALHLRVDNKEELQRLVLNLRQLVRLKQMEAIELAKEPEELEDVSDVKLGQLDVLLIEAKNLFPRRRRGAGDVVDAILGGQPVLEVMKDVLQQDKQEVFVRLRMTRGSKAVAMNGQQHLDSPICKESRSPCWASSSQDGWAFSSSAFEADAMPDLFLELEVIHLEFATETLIGKARLPVTKENFLTSAEVPFRNLWLPLAIEVDGKWIVTQCGDLHIMTLWRPLDAQQRRSHLRGETTAGCSAGVQSCSSCMEYLKQRVRTQLRSMEPLAMPGVGHISRTDLHLLLDGGGGEAFDLLRKSCMTWSRSACIEQRSRRAWTAYLQTLPEEVSLGEMRLYWSEKSEEAKNESLKELLLLGLPECLRPQIWLDLSLGRRCREKHASAGQGYSTFLDAGKRLLGPTPLKQLQEDSLSFGVDLYASADSSRERKLLHQAKNVCTAFIGFSAPLGKESAANLENGPGLGYCQSLLAIAFHMLASGETTFREEEVFWILHALCNSSANGAYRDYFGLQMPQRGAGTFPQGPAEDALLLDCALAVHEPALRTRLAALGIPVAALFWPHFQRVFAGGLLSLPLRRFWDMLIAKSTEPMSQPHPRHVLVDLAFGVLQGLRERIFDASSVDVVTQLVTSFLLDLSDPEDLVDLLVQSEAVLWQGFRRHEVLRLWDVASGQFSRFLCRYGQQDDLVMHQLMTLDPFDTRALGWLTPDFILTRVLPLLRAAVPETTALTRCARRQLPEALLDQLYLDLPTAGSFLSFAGLVGAIWQDETPTEVSSVEPDLTPLESRLSMERWSSILQEKFPGWRDKAEEIFRAFRWESRTAIEDEELPEQMSMNEFLAGLICCSLGTAAEKAAALFELCAEERAFEPEFPHRIPLSRVVIQRRGEANSSAGAVVPGTPPSSYVLEIEVWANEYRQRAGSVFVESLWPWTSGSNSEEELRRQGLPFVVWSECSPAARRVGELRLGISWTPRNPQTPEVGLLSLCVSRLRLYDFESKPEVTGVSALPRPWLQARTLDKDGLPRPIMRRGRQGFALKDGLLRSWASDASQSMTWSSQDASLNEDGQSWSWATDVLESSPKLRFTAGAARPAGHGTVISLGRCRQVADGLLRRSGLYLTARQVSQLADRCFQRLGRSSAIVDALLLAGSEPPAELQTPSSVRSMCQETGRPYLDVTSQLVREMERCFSSGSIQLENLQLEDPFPGAKILWIRLGSGSEASTLLFPWDAGHSKQLTFDSAELSSELLTKEEFISCVLAHPALSEPLKRRQPQLLTMDAMRTLTLDVLLELSPRSEKDPQYLPVLFGELSGSSDVQDGAGHGIKVFLTDTMWDFLEKLQEACQRLAKLPHADSKYYQSMTLGLEHEVFAFVPQTLAVKPKESLHDLMRAHADAASWLILNKDCTFQSYASILYQQPDMLPCLKVSRR